jgi:hypothetical protein
MGQFPGCSDKSWSDKLLVALLMVAFVIANLWYDTYHRLGFFFDAIVEPDKFTRRVTVCGPFGG